mmetsp:Transcript_46260/g.148537  ORF Transcript_46260/g.148537 Transcript_46260/m.148537 type:complete len:292 (+) Transcript_46260:946-1821(+)
MLGEPQSLLEVLALGHDEVLDANHQLVRDASCIDQLPRDPVHDLPRSAEVAHAQLQDILVEVPHLRRAKGGGAARGSAALAAAGAGALERGTVGGGSGGGPRKLWGAAAARAAAAGGCIASPRRQMLLRPGLGHGVELRLQCLDARAQAPERDPGRREVVAGDEGGHGQLGALQSPLQRGHLPPKLRKVTLPLHLVPMVKRCERGGRGGSRAEVGHAGRELEGLLVARPAEQKDQMILGPHHVLARNLRGHAQPATMHAPELAVGSHERLQKRRPVLVVVVAAGYHILLHW